MALDHDGEVGDFRRSGLRRVFEEYRAIVQAALDDALLEETAKTSLRKRLAKLEELGKQWTSAWFQLGLGQAQTPNEQDAREDALLQLEARLAKECPNIFKSSYYRYEFKTIPDPMTEI